MIFWIKYNKINYKYSKSIEFDTAKKNLKYYAIKYSYHKIPLVPKSFLLLL